jgi:hypothetical protein
MVPAATTPATTLAFRARLTRPIAGIGFASGGRLFVVMVMMAMMVVPARS